MVVEHLFADTNLFLRYLTNDIPEQAQAFEVLLHRAERNDLLLVTHSLVIAEIVWTLESYYNLSKEDIQTKVLAILNTPGLEVTQKEIILQAILWYVERNVDFIDSFSVAWMLSQEITKACSFDAKHFGRFNEIEIISPRQEQ